jgi:hypothetical protein
MNFDFSHLKSPPFPKLILLYGPGNGKTTIRRLLTEKYREQGIDCLSAYNVAELEPLNKGAALYQSQQSCCPPLDRKEDFEGVIFLEVNDAAVSSYPFTPTYVIFFPDQPVNIYQEKDNK